MDNEIQLISEGDGLAVIGESKAVEHFLASEGLPSKDLGLPRLKKVLGVGAAGVQVGSEIAANSGRWVKLTKESAEAIRKYGLMDNDIRRQLRDGGEAGRRRSLPTTAGSDAPADATRSWRPARDR